MSEPKKCRIESNDPVNPSHYTDLKISPITFITENNMCYLSGNILKYLARYKNKNGIEDLKKAKWYLEFLIKQEEESVNNIGTQVFGEIKREPVSEIDKILFDHAKGFYEMGERVSDIESRLKTMLDSIVTLGNEVAKNAKDIEFLIKENTIEKYELNGVPLMVSFDEEKK